jgi:CBS domain containing-hemolysin-like protein
LALVERERLIRACPRPSSSWCCSSRSRLLTLGELAVLTSRKSRLREAAEHSRGARVAFDLANHPERFLSAIQIWITLTAILLGYFGEDTLGWPSRRSSRRSRRWRRTRTCWVSCSASAAS